VQRAGYSESEVEIDTSALELEMDQVVLKLEMNTVASSSG
jgi:hypothetical protein